MLLKVFMKIVVISRMLEAGTLFYRNKRLDVPIPAKTDPSL